MDDSERFVAGEGSSSYKFDVISPRLPSGYDNLNVNRWSSLPPHLIEKV